MYLKPDNLPKESEEAISKLRLFSIYKNLKLQSLKFDTNFQVYEEILNCFVGKKFTFVEIGVLGGGSLLMWREYFGKQAVDISIMLQLISLYISSNEGFCLYGSDLIEPSTLNVCNL